MDGNDVEVRADGVTAARRAEKRNYDRSWDCDAARQGWVYGSVPRGSSRRVEDTIMM